MLSRLMFALLLLALTSFAWERASAQVVLFEGPDFKGAKISIGAAEPDVGNSDFRDRARSLIVRGGVWEICQEVNFGGECQDVPEGEYQRLNSRFNRRIASVRPVDEAPPPPRPKKRSFWDKLETLSPHESGNPPPPSVWARPSSCSVPPSQTNSCPGCSVSCTNGAQATCRQGQEWPGGSPTCMRDAVCECR